MNLTRKYLSFQPWLAGFSNVIMSLEIAIALSKISNRVIILPDKVHIGNILTSIDPDLFMEYLYVFKDNWGIENIRHSEFELYKNIPYNYTGVEQFARIVYFAGDNPGQVDLPHANSHPANLRMDYAYVNQFEDDQIIHFPKNLFGRFYYNVECDCSELIKSCLDYHPKYYERIGITEKFNSIHYRSGDFWSFTEDRIKDPHDLLAAVRKYMDNSLPLYIATDCEYPDFFSILGKEYRLLFFDDVYSSEFNTLERAVMDQLTCTVSERFIGSRLSTFSDRIHILRAYNNKKLNYLNSLTTDRQEWDGKSYHTWDNLSSRAWVNY